MASSRSLSGGHLLPKAARPPLILWRRDRLPLQAGEPIAEEAPKAGRGKRAAEKPAKKAMATKAASAARA